MLFGVLEDLEDLDAGVVVAAQPAYHDLDKVRRFAERASAQVAIPVLLRPTAFLVDVVDRALEPVGVTCFEVLSESAIGALAGVLASSEHDMRTVLRTADDALDLARRRHLEHVGADLIVETLELEGRVQRA